MHGQQLVIIEKASIHRELVIDTECLTSVFTTDRTHPLQLCLSATMFHPQHHDYILGFLQLWFVLHFIRVCARYSPVRLSGRGGTILS